MWCTCMYRTCMYGPCMIRARITVIFIFISRNIFVWDVLVNDPTNSIIILSTSVLPLVIFGHVHIIMVFLFIILGHFQYIVVFFITILLFLCRLNPHFYLPLPLFFPDSIFFTILIFWEYFDVCPLFFLLSCLFPFTDCNDVIVKQEKKTTYMYIYYVRCVCSR